MGAKLVENITANTERKNNEETKEKTNKNIISIYNIFSNNNSMLSLTRRDFKKSI